MLMSDVLFLFLTLVRVPAISISNGAEDQETFYGDLDNGHSLVDLDTTSTNNQRQKRSASAFEMAIRHIWNKAARIVRVKDGQYLLVRGYRADAVNDFYSFKPKLTGTNVDLDGPLVGHTGNKIVRLSSAKGRAAPVLEIKNDSPVDTSVMSVVYVDNDGKMENVYDFIKKHKHLPDGFIPQTNLMY